MTETFDDEPSLGRRLVALLIDWVIASLSAVAMFAWVGVTFPPEGIRDQLIINAVFIVEVAILIGLTGFSIGKRIMGLRLINPDGMPIGIPRALLRTLLLSVVIPAIVMTDDKRGLHDLAAGSKVVKA